MNVHALGHFLFWTLTLATFGNTASARSVFLNGVDISSARNQELKDVDITIDANGHIIIHAPHYQINEEETFVPLTKYVGGVNQPRHQPMMPLTKNPSDVR